MLKHILTVGVGGFIGAIARFGVCDLIYRYYKGRFPAGTLVVNTLGCFAIGIAIYLLENRPFLNPNVRLFYTIGVLGAFTTFSTFGYETFELIKGASIQLALGNIAVNILLGLVAVVGGRALAGLLGI